VLVGSVVQLTVMRIRKECFRRVLALDYQTLKMQGTSELMSRFTYDVEAARLGVGPVGGQTRSRTAQGAGLRVPGLLGQLAIDAALGAVRCLIAAVAFHRIGKMLKKASQKSMESVARIYKVLEETLRGD